MEHRPSITGRVVILFSFKTTKNKLYFTLRLHSITPQIPERQSEVTEPLPPYISLDSQQFNLNLTKPKANYSGPERVRHSFSVAETKFENRLTKFTPIGLDSAIVAPSSQGTPEHNNRDSFISLE